MDHHVIRDDRLSGADHEIAELRALVLQRVEAYVDVRLTLGHASGDEISDAVVSVMMGGLVPDLRHTKLTRRPAHLDILSVMGGVQLVVPAEWKLRIDVEPTMAGIRDGRTGSIDAERPPDLVLAGRVVMSGLEISSEMPGEGNRRSAT